MAVGDPCLAGQQRKGLGLDVLAARGRHLLAASCGKHVQQNLAPAVVPHFGYGAPSRTASHQYETAVRGNGRPRVLVRARGETAQERPCIAVRVSLAPGPESEGNSDGAGSLPALGTHLRHFPRAQRDREISRARFRPPLVRLGQFQPDHDFAGEWIQAVNQASRGVVGEVAGRARGIGRQSPAAGQTDRTAAARLGPQVGGGLVPVRTAATQPQKSEKCKRGFRSHRVRQPRADSYRLSRFLYPSLAR